MHAVANTFERPNPPPARAERAAHGATATKTSHAQRLRAGVALGELVRGHIALRSLELWGAQIDLDAASAARARAVGTRWPFASLVLHASVLRVAPQSCHALVLRGVEARMHTER